MSPSWGAIMYIRDYVFPIVTINENDGIERFLGTGFLIGNKAFGLTAAHVINGFDKKKLAALFVRDNKWIYHWIVDTEIHPSEDVALIKLNLDKMPSIFELEYKDDFSSCRYSLWGYPEDVAQELHAHGSVLTNPDLIYNEGYVRRRISHNFDAFKGGEFFELNEVAGAGVSGGPVYKGRPHQSWLVIGIYIGERLNERSTSVSYAVRVDAFRDWVPKILGTSLIEESKLTEQSSL